MNLPNIIVKQIVLSVFLLLRTVAAVPYIAPGSTPIINSRGEAVYITGRNELVRLVDGKVSIILTQVRSKTVSYSNDEYIASSGEELICLNSTFDRRKTLGKIDLSIRAFSKWTKDEWIIVSEKSIWHLDLKSRSIKKVIELQSKMLTPSLSVDYQSGRIYIIGFPSGINCFSINGENLWSRDLKFVGYELQTGGCGMGAAGPLILLPGNESIAVWDGGRVERFDAYGNLKWFTRVGIGLEYMGGTGSTVNSCLYLANRILGSQGGVIVCVDMESGKVVWKSILRNGANFGPYYRRTENDLAIFEVDSSISMYRTDGTHKMSIPPNGRADCPIIGSDGHLSLIQRNGEILSLTPK